MCPLRLARPPWPRASPVLPDFGFGSQPSEAGWRPYSAMMFPPVRPDCASYRMIPRSRFSSVDNDTVDNDSAVTVRECRRTPPKPTARMVRILSKIVGAPPDKPFKSLAMEAQRGRGHTIITGVIRKLHMIAFPDCWRHHGIHLLVCFRSHRYSYLVNRPGLVSAAFVALRHVLHTKALHYGVSARLSSDSLIFRPSWPSPLRSRRLP